MEAIKSSVERNKWNMTTTAEELGISRMTLYRKLDQYGLRSKESNTVEIFSYIARDQKSSVVKGEIKAIEERIVLEQLKKMGLDPISITVKKVSVLEKLDVNVFDSVPPDAIYNFSDNYQ